MRDILAARAPDEDKKNTSPSAMGILETSFILQWFLFLPDNLKVSHKLSVSIEVEKEEGRNLV
jgi:hypothetical protein